jgi:uncharacterized protein (TIGR03435 family)
MRSILVLPLLAAAGLAQAPVFEAASVKPNRSMGGRSSIHLSKGLVQMENVSLMVILNAYGIPDDRQYAVSGPGWLATESFDINARFPAETPGDQVRQMMQALLAERFHMEAHKETRQLPIYTLTVAKSGPKIHAADDGQGQTSGGPGRLEATRTSMAKLANLLARMLGTPVTDATGLAGVYDFKLEWAPDETLRNSLAPEPGGAASGGGPSLTTAVEEQLGLKLTGGKGPVEVVVIDRIERTPTGN